MRYNVDKSTAAVNVQVGDDIVVRLPELAAAGYEWHLPSKLPAGLVPFDVPSSVDGDVAVAVGGQTPHAFGLHVRAKGKHVLHFQSYRSWEGPSAANETYSLKVNAQALTD